MAKKKKSTSAKKKKNTGFKLPDLSDERIPRIIGSCLLIFALLLAVALTSYVITIDADQGEVLNKSIWKLLFASAENNVEIKNHLGVIGAKFSHILIRNGFGLASYIFPFWLFVLGINLLLRKKLFNLKKAFGYGFLLLNWLAPALAFAQYLVQGENGVIWWGGAYGTFLAGSMNGVPGKLIYWIKPLGTAALLILSALIFAIWVFNLNFNGLIKLFQSTGKKQDESDIEEEDKEKAFGVGESIFEKDGIELKEEKKEEKTTTKEEETALEIEVKKPEVVAPPVDPKPEVKEEKPAEAEFEEVTNNVTKKKTPPQEDVELKIEETVEEKIIDDNKSLGTYDPTLDLSNYKYPGLDLLIDHGGDIVKMDAEELDRNKNQIIETLNNYKIEISKIKATIGPTVTLYEIVPAPGVRISKIKNLEDDIALSLAALGIRIIAPIPGKGTIGIEVPNEKKEIVSMKTLLSSEKFRSSKMELPIALGKTISNEIKIADLTKMPHLLMAGATGQGKSVGINAIIVSLLYKKHPSQLKFVLVDPKKVELSIYSTIEKHFLAKLPGEEEAIITDTKKVVNTLNALCIEMDDRYELLKKAHCRNVKEYNKKFTDRRLNPQNGHRYLPLIVVVIDEFADLIMTAGKEVEMPIARLAQLARAIGIHLILATQRPSVNIITGIIKANFPARISFKVTSKVDSRTILDQGGADQLIGRGDMLLAQGSDTVRIQCGFVDTPEVEAICTFIQEQQGYPDAFLLPEYVGEDADGGAKGGYSANDRDELFEDAARLVVNNQMGSTSLIQRRMKLGYNRAGRIMDQLEDAGIVGPNVGSKAREVLYKTEAELEQYLEILKETS